jgi:hypothetical protein
VWSQVYIFSLFGVFVLIPALALSPALEVSMDYKLPPVCNWVYIVTQGPRRLDILLERSFEHIESKEDCEDTG